MRAIFYVAMLASWYMAFVVTNQVTKEPIFKEISVKCKNIRLFKRAVVTPSMSYISTCGALMKGTGALRNWYNGEKVKLNLCRFFKMNHGIAWNKKLKTLQTQELTDSMHFTCDHLLELDTLERAFRAELRELHRALSVANPELSNQLCSLFTSELKEKYENVVNGPGNLYFVQDEIEKTKGAGFGFLHRGEVRITNEVAEFYLKTGFEPGMQLLKHPIMQAAHVETGHKMETIFMEFAEKFQSSAMKTCFERRLSPIGRKSCIDLVQGVYQKIQEIAKQGNIFINGNLKKMPSQSINDAQEVAAPLHPLGRLDLVQGALEILNSELNILAATGHDLNGMLFKRRFPCI